MKVNFKINERFYEAIHAKTRHIVLSGGAGSGKSHFAAQKLLMKIISEPGRRELVVRKVFGKIKESCFYLLRILIANAGIEDKFDINESPLKITCKANGSHIIFTGMDDPEKLKSIHGITGVWVEEATELTEKDAQEIERRLREKSNLHKQIIWSFNPISRKHWLRKRFFTDPEGTKPVDNICYIHSTYLNNLSNLDDEYVEELLTLKKRDPEDYMIYVLGQWGSGEPGNIFTREHMRYWHTLPDDLFGVIYTDPNLAKKGEGDTTATSAVMYSYKTALYYLVDYRCTSFDNPSNLLKSVLDIKSAHKGITTIGFDGHVNQESNWSSHVRNYCLTNIVAPPIIQYKRYHVDALAKNAQWVWTENRVMLPHNIEETYEGQEYVLQLTTFAGKANSQSKKDDAPDSLICAIELFHETFTVPMKALPENAHKDFTQKAQELNVL